MLPDATDEQVAALKAFRDAIGVPSQNTVMQKVIPADQISTYITEARRPRGFVATADDAGTSVFQTSDEMVEGLRLDHLGDPDTVGIIEWELVDEAAIEIPYSPRYGGSTVEDHPFNGNGLVNNPDRIVPESKIADAVEITPSNGAMFVLDRQGNKQLVAIWENGAWSPVP